MRLRSRHSLAAAMVTCLVLMTGSPATASTYDLSRVHDGHSFLLSDCPGVNALVQYDFDVFLHAVQKGNDRIVYYTEHDRGTRTITNLDTGKSVVEVTSVSNKDQRVTDNGDGTFTIRTKIAGQFRTYGPDGKVILNEAGSTLYDLLIDNAGTAQDPSDDTVIDQTFVRETGRHNSVGTFCAVFSAATA
jgi:hypothetical protein